MKSEANENTPTKNTSDCIHGPEIDECIKEDKGYPKESRRELKKYSYIWKVGTQFI